ncbi:MAG: hypothetical protein V4685_05580 [Bacteroidota bacterium]
MKLFKSLTTFAFVTGMFFISSCNSGETKTETTGDTATKKEETPAPTPPAPAKPANVMIVWHKVANFSKWLPSYESHDSVKLANGLHNYVLGRGVTDSNMVMVALTMDDADKAKAFAASPELKEAMKKSGAMGAPKFAYIDVQMMDASTNASTLRVMRMFKVKDYDAWKKAFDANKQIRTDAGLTDRALGYSVGDNHNVTLVYAVADKKKAEDYFNSPELKERMKTGGVEGTPETFWYNVAKKY